MNQSKAGGTEPFWQRVEKRSWEELLAEDWGGYQPPVTTHLPIHPVLSRDFLHVGPALQVVRQRIVPGLNVNDLESLQRVSSDEILVVQFAFGKAPAVPDFQTSRLALEENCWPIARAEYYTHDGLFYEFTYFVRALPDDPAQTVLWIQGSVTNEDRRPRGAHVRAKIGFHPENEILDYHYAPYYWDASKYLPSPDVALEENEIKRRNVTIGKINPGEFDCRWEESADFEHADYGRQGVENSPPHTALRCLQVRDVLHLQRELSSGDCAQFELALLVNYEDADEEHRAFLRDAQSAENHAAVLQHFRDIAGGNKTRLNCAAKHWSDIFAALPQGMQQLLVRFDDVPGWMPTEGGSSERHFVWVSEATHILVPLLKLGYTEPVRQALRFIFSLQDSGFKPQGRLTSTEGAVGTSGPKWLSSTGSALTTAAEYYLHSRDESFLTEFLPGVLRAMDWVLTELRATRILNDDGSRPPWYGLMPFGCANDGDIGYFPAFTDAFTYEGLERLLVVLETIGHERAGELKKEVEQYRHDLTAAATALARADGFIERQIVIGDAEEERYTPFDRVCGAYHLAVTNVLDVESPLLDAYVEWYECELGSGIFMGSIDRDTAYMGWPEWAWQEIYLRRGEWKKAFALTQINLKYAKSGDAHQFQERFRCSDPAFCPWQPNGSGNGRMLEMMLKSFYFEYHDMVTLLAGVPYAWLRQNGLTELFNLHTPHGIFSLRAKVDDADLCLVSLWVENGILPGRIRFPDHFEVESVSEGMGMENGYYVPAAGSVRCEWRIRPRTGSDGIPL